MARWDWIFFPRGQFLQQEKSFEFTHNMSLAWQRKWNVHLILTNTHELLSPFCSWGTEAQRGYMACPDPGDNRRRAGVWTRTDCSPHLLCSLQVSGLFDSETTLHSLSLAFVVTCISSSESCLLPEAEYLSPPRFICWSPNPQYNGVWWV